MAYYAGNGTLSTVEKPPQVPPMAPADGYDCPVPARENIQANVEAWLAERGESRDEFVERARVARRTFYRLMEKGTEGEATSPRLSLLEAIARAFRVEVWVLLLPQQMPLKVARQFSKLPDPWAAAGDEGREMIVRTATAEARYRR